MRPWYETAFGRDYLDRYPHRNDAEARDDVDAIVRLLEPNPSHPLLDLGCGAGRHLVAFCRAGYRRLVGLDLSEELLAVARHRIAEAGCGKPDLHCLDMRRIPYKDHFGIAVSLFTSFGYFESDDENSEVLLAVHRALRPGGRFLLDTMNRAWTIEHLVPEEVIDLPGGTADVTRTLSEDGERVEKVVRITDPSSSEVTVRRESVRMYAPEELVEMFARAGFADADVFGSLHGDPPFPSAERTVVVGTKRSA